MLCDEQCLFLEIAQVIRGLELTIRRVYLRPDPTKHGQGSLSRLPGGSTDDIMASDAVSAAQKKPHLKQDLMRHLFSK
ncbi:hypothetical protein GH714_042382 [Hevea brasiliensis]|uniref:Uncharacterized protein n=1 Tax=Hevea brasiliensis TaxID=3981 RepID=A0A6A6KM30_HEVBR|nr:hypothetical protein GH714_042382 [Hevea brasiliensis]